MTLKADQVPSRIARFLSPSNNDGRLLALLTTLLLGASWPLFGGFTALALAAGAATSVLIRWWFNQHPSDLPTPNGRSRRSPEINFSLIPVGGDAGGLILVCGCLAIVLLGVPTLRAPMLVATICAAVRAGLLILWRRQHPLWTPSRTWLRNAV